MALWPNNRRDITGQFPTSHTGYLVMQQSNQSANVPKNLAYFGNNSISSQSSIPEGAFESYACILTPIAGGGMSSGGNAIDIDMVLSGNVLSAKTASGSASMLMSADGGLSLQVGMGGEATISFTTNAAILALTIGLDGEATWTLSTNNAVLSLIVPGGGTASITMTGTANLKGFADLAGESTPFEELSPQNLAIAVWNYLIESNFTAEQCMKLISAVSAGETVIVDNGGGSATVTFKSLDGTVDRAVFDMQDSERIDRTDDLS